MINLKIAAVGSSPQIAGEIAAAIHFILGENIEIDVFSINELETASRHDIYVCATTQLKKLQALLPKEKIVLLELIPTAKFFISVARIPEGETIHIFNNYFAYAYILGNYCESLGISNVKFIPIAYCEMLEEDILSALQQAHYIIGVDKFIYDVLCTSPKYMAVLSKNVQLIAATRVASIQSACTLLRCIATKLHYNIAAHVKNLRSALENATTPTTIITKSVNDLLLYSAHAIETIQTAIVKSATNHIEPDIPKSLIDDNQTNIASSPLQLPNINASLTAILQLNDQLALIAKKLKTIQ